MKKRLRIIISLMLCAFLTSSCANTSTGAAQPAAEQPVAEQQTAAQPAAEQPVAEQQTAAQPATEQPAAEQPATAQLAAEQKTPDQATYTYTEYSLERNGIPLHLDCMKVDGTELKVIPGGSHIVLYEKDCYREFQDSVAAFLMQVSEGDA